MSDLAELVQYDMHVDGRDVASVTGRRFQSIDPTTGDAWATFPDAGSEDVHAAVRAAQDAFPTWRNLSPTRRGRLMMRLGELIEENAETIAAIEVRENGKLLREMVGQLSIIPDWYFFFGGLADKVEGRVIPVSRPGVLNYTLREPLGVVGVITPWNSPVLLATQSLAPALAAGNTCVLKPSEVTSASMIEIARLADEAGFPGGVLNVVTGVQEAGRALAEHPGVAKVAFTGGPAVGRQVAMSAAERLRGYVLELGGKSANIVFEDCDKEAALAGVVGGIFAAGGQSCTAGSRALVHESIFDDFLAAITTRTRELRLGDPKDDSVAMGPIATREHLSRIASAVDSARSAGATVVTGGRKGDVSELPHGYFYEPTIVSGASPSDTIAVEEVFGPVLTVLPFRDETEAVKLANATPYGLAAGVWTQSIKRAHRVAAALEAGTIWINIYRAVSYNSPFGGYKDSGLGRVNGVEAINEFLQTKSVWVELKEEVNDPFSLR